MQKRTIQTLNKDCRKNRQTVSKMSYFDSDKWLKRALDDLISFQEIEGFISNSSTRKAFTETTLLRSFVGERGKRGEKYSGIKNKLDNEIKNKLLEITFDALDDSLEHFAALTIVSMCTTYETASRDFAIAMFSKYPAYMHDYLSNDKSKGQVDIKEIIEAGEYEQLIENLAKKSSTIITKGKYGVILKRLSTLAKYEKDENLIDSLNEIQTKRNLIVHVKKKLSIDSNEVGHTYDIFANSIKFYCKVACAKKIPGYYTCIRD